MHDEPKAIKQLCYVSFLSDEYETKEVVNSLKEISGRKNPKYNITGKLLYSNAVFLQLLEGPTINVDITYRIIEEDKRHFNPHILFEKYSSKRVFPDWAMKFTEVNDLNLSLINKILHYNVNFGEDDFISNKMIKDLFWEFEKKMNKES